MMIDVAKARYKQITHWETEYLERKLQEAEGWERSGDEAANITVDDEEGLWQWHEEQVPEGLGEDGLEEEEDWALLIDMDGNELPTLPKSPGPGVPAEPGEDLSGKSVQNHSGDLAGRKPEFVGMVRVGGLEGGGASILRPPQLQKPQNRGLLTTLKVVLRRPGPSRSKAVVTRGGPQY